MISKILASCLAIGLAASANALTLKEKKDFESEKALLMKADSYDVTNFKEKCGFHLPITMDEGMVAPFMAANTSMASFCGIPRNKMANMCDDATTKAAIKTKIKSMKCMYNTKKDEVSFAIKGGVLELKVGEKASEFSDKFKDFLENNL